MALLEVKNISKSFGGVLAVCDFSMTLEAGEVVGIIGPNGAGKTTIFNVISKVYAPDSGSVWLGDKNISELTQEAAARAGVGRTFQNIRLFNTLNVLDNVKVAGDYALGYTFFEAVCSLPRRMREEKKVRGEAMELLNLVGLEKYAEEKPSSLPYGLQRRLEIARALAVRPRVLLLDEPAAGLNPEECRELVGFLKDVCRGFDVALLIIEHRMDVIMNICHRIYVQDFGRNIAAGSPEEIQSNEAVLGAYLGEDNLDAGD